MSALSYYALSPQTYDEQFWWKKDDIEFWKSLIPSTDRRVLELAAGTGRIGLPLIKENISYTGIDLSQAYVDRANAKLPNENPPLFYQADMRCFQLKKQYDIIIIGFNSFLHLLNNEDAMRCLNTIKAHMNKTSYLYIDMFIPHPLFLYRPQTLRLHVVDFYDSYIQSNAMIEETLSYNPKNEIASVIWYYLNESGKEYMQFHFQMKMYYPDTMNRLLIDAGFIIKDIWGSYDYDKCNENSSLQIYKCTI